MKVKKQDASTLYGIRRYFEPSPNPASYATNSSARARRKPVLSPTTYQDLLTTQERLVRQGNTNPRTAANRASALRSFLKIHNIQLEDPIGQEFRTTYREHVEQFIEHLRIEGRKQHNITNTLAALRPWREMVVAIDTDRAVAGDNLAPFNQALTRLLDSHSIANLAKQLSIPVDMLYGWLKGKKPRLSNASHVYRIEKFFGVEHENWRC